MALNHVDRSFHKYATLFVNDFKRRFKLNFFRDHQQQPIAVGEIEIDYNMYRMRRLLSLGPPNNAIQETYKPRLDR
jgi:hypothetical protein